MLRFDRIFFVYMTLEWKSDMIVKYDHGCEVQVVKMNSETWLLFIPFSFVISTWIQIFLVIFCRWGGMHYSCICKIIRIAWSYKCVNHDMCKIKIKLLEENSKWKILDWQGNLSLLHSLLKVLLPKFCAQ